MKRKKYEFKPDPSGAGLLSHLYITQQQRRRLLRVFLNIVIVGLMMVVQDVILSRGRLLGATTDLVPGGILMMCVLQGTQTGSVFGLLAALGYWLSGSAPGVYVIVLITVLGIGGAAFRENYLRRGFLACMLCSWVTIFLYEMAVFGMGLFLRQTTAGRLPVFLLTAALSCAAVPVIYPPCAAIERLGGDVWKE